MTDRQTDTQRQRDIMPEGVYQVGNQRVKEYFIVKSLDQGADRRPKPENSNNLPDGFNLAWLWTEV